ncbi:MAG: SCO family protein, partial [Candidatus Binatia bacterium]
MTIVPMVRSDNGVSKLKEGISIQKQVLWGLLAVVLAVVVGTAVWTWQGTGTRQGGWDEKRLEGLNKTFGTVPDFSLTERSGRQVGLADLKGKVWVVLFFYTDCRDICPLIVPQMGLLHLEYKNDPEFRSDIRFVSITVDPERDTPKVLAKFAERFSADPELWLFLTGEKATIYRLTREGFKVGMGEVENPPDVKQKTGEEKEIFHSSRLILVDRKAQIRGY